MTANEITLNPNHWVKNHSDYLISYARKRVKCEEKVKDLVQETFIGGLTSSKNFKSDCTERTWLTSILKHKIIDHYRKKNTQRGKIEQVTISHEEYFERHYKDAPIAYDYVSDLDRDEKEIDLNSKIKACLGKLTKQQAQIFEMKYLKEYDSEMISEKMNISRNSVWVSLCRAKKTLLSDAQFRQALAA